MFYQEYDFLHDGSDNEGDGDMDGGESSDDDDLRRVLRDIGGIQDEDDFEASMERELNNTVHSLEAQRRSSDGSRVNTSIASAPLLALPSPGSSSIAEGAGIAKAEPETAAKSGKKAKTVKFAKEKPPNFYDDDYFDSDDDDEAPKSGLSGPGERKKHPIPTNDDLFYDPDQDDKDQAWVDKQRDKYQPKAVESEGRQSPGKAKRAKEKGLSTSDAVLNCPACMTTLCLDCQRHEVYHQQYRAMFVKNCVVDMGQSLKYKTKNHSNKKQRATSDGAPTGDEDLYHPVKCTECGTEVAVYDKEEVYHFFNVLASHA